MNTRRPANYTRLMVKVKPSQWPKQRDLRETLSVIAPLNAGLQILRGEGRYYGLGDKFPHVDTGQMFAGGMARAAGRGIVLSRNDRPEWK